jgi:predicted aspartyl protease
MRLPFRLKESHDEILALIDTGTSKSIVSENLVNKYNTELSPSTMNFDLVNGLLKSKGSSQIKFILPTLKRKALITHSFQVISECKDQMIIGRDLLSTLGLVINFRDHTIEWDGNIVAFQTNKTFEQSEEEIKKVPDETQQVQPKDLLPETNDEIAKESLLKLLTTYQDLYSGRLGKIKLPEYVLPVSKDYIPIHSKPYPIPKAYEQKARKEIQRLIELDVLEEIYSSETASPAFFIIKPSGLLRLLNDFRHLNKYLKRSPYFVPLIRDILSTLGEAKYFSTVDANMGYYARVIAEESRKFTAFYLRFGKYQFKRLPMGVSTAPDEYQATMSRIFSDLHGFVIVYLDDILIFSSTLEEHLDHLEQMFKRLQKYDITLNPKKC